ncbi:MAG: bifunctional glutamate N-acetyltransferase/amino-acid acetyltransferase ArgJ [Thiohalobacterales bacterium]|nr:bifunctional glutamate N-acetyltransferase/amino-acid acetyltransferase ArgJ [Thiohalobacterales bacterium]
MNEKSDIAPELLPVAGFRLGTACAGIKYPDRRDLVVMEMAPGSTCAAVFTRNAFCAAPVALARRHLAAMPPRYLLVNSGNANAGTGERGMQDARGCCERLAGLAGLPVKAVLPFSTGVIGEALPMEKMIAGIPAAMANLADDGWVDAARGIMTTDTVPKAISRQLQLDGQTVTITGMAKGSGMIRPDMATMLAYIATDAAVEAGVLQSCLEYAVARSFNRITVDGDTSTNDACVLVATGGCGMPVIRDRDSRYEQLASVVTDICEWLARAIVRDGEGATKFVTVIVEQGATADECLQVAYTIAHSPLVKTALFASDPNWGRILAAVGRSGLPGLDLAGVDIHLGGVCLISGGEPAADYTEAAGQAAMSGEEITIRVLLGRGGASERVWTCDLSYDYVRINAEYRT